MDTFTLLKYWIDRLRPTHTSSTNSDFHITTVTSSPGQYQPDHEGPFINLELAAVPENYFQNKYTKPHEKEEKEEVEEEAKEMDVPLSCMSSSPSALTDALLHAKLLSVNSYSLSTEAKNDTIIAQATTSLLLKSVTKFRVFFFFTVKIKVEETPTSSSSSSSSSSSCVSKRYASKLGFSGEQAEAQPSYAGNEQEITAPAPVGVEEVIASTKGMKIVAGLLMTRKRLRIRSSSSATVAAAPSTAAPPGRRDDSLREQHDGIQSAILHCKRSLNPIPTNTVAAADSESGMSLVTAEEEESEDGGVRMMKQVQRFCETPLLDKSKVGCEEFGNE